MRTKTLLLTAALTAAGIASSMAQVYSVNVVGYINKSIPSGFAMIANQLSNSPDNKVATIIPTPPEGTIVYKFNPATGGYQVISFLDGAYEGDDVNMTLNPGEGVFIKSPSAHAVTFVGEVVKPNTTIPSGFSVRSSVLPQSLPLDQLEFPASEGDIVYNFNPASGGYKVSSFLDGAWEGDFGGAPTPSIGESFFVKHSGAATTWVRTFTP